MDKPPYDSVYADHYANWRKAHERADKKPRKHAELIKAYADGADIQWQDSAGRWVDIPHPCWMEDSHYRIKPAPKADYTEKATIHMFRGVVSVHVTFDGETGEAKKVEIVK